MGGVNQPQVRIQTSNKSLPELYKPLSFVNLVGTRRFVIQSIETFIFFLFGSLIIKLNLIFDVLISVITSFSYEAY